MLTREQLLSKREEIIASIDELCAQEFNYVCFRPFQQFGLVSEMSQNVLVAAYAKLKELDTNLAGAAEELGIAVIEEQTFWGSPKMNGLRISRLVSLS